MVLNGLYRHCRITSTKTKAIGRTECVASWHNACCLCARFCNKTKTLDDRIRE